MANQLKMAKVQSIRTLHQRGWSQRRIARELGIHRETVGRYVLLTQQEPAEPAKVPAGSVRSKPAKVPAGSIGPPERSCSACQPLREVILAKLEQGLSAQRIWQDLVVEQGLAHGYDSVKRFVRKLRQATPLPFRRMECAPGEEAQVDFGRGAPIVGGDGRRRGCWVFRIVLSHSRKGYSEAVFRQSTDGFLQALENAFWDFGGVPRTIVIDNLKAAVKKADWFDPDLNPKVQAFCEHYGTVILPTKPYTPRHKGKIERGIGYVRNNALKARTFGSLNQQNRHLGEWEAHIADTRIHGTTRRQVGKVFAEVEQAALLALPAGRFPNFCEAQRIVHRDGHVEVAKAYYSVPPEYVGHRVWVRWDGRLVRVFTKRMELIAVHAQHEPGQFSTQWQHIPSRKISWVERGTACLLARASLLGPNVEHWARAMLQARGIQGVRVLLGLVSLGNRHRSDRIDKACAIAVTHEAFRLRAIRELIQREGRKQEAFEYLAEHEIIRDLARYGELVAASFRRESVEALAWQEKRS
jgi:transposase